MLVETGHSYERKNILKWLDVNETCPISGQSLEDTTLVTNWNLRKSIDEWISFQPGNSE